MEDQQQADHQPDPQSDHGTESTSEPAPEAAPDAELPQEFAALQLIAKENTRLKAQLKQAREKIQTLQQQQKTDREKWTAIYEELQLHVEFMDNCAREFSANSDELKQTVKDLEEQLVEKDRQLQQAREDAAQWQEQLTRLLDH